MRECGSAVKPMVYIVILNWNGWQHTLECLESVFRLKYPHYRVVVCDNASTDCSMERICEWANGSLKARTPEQEELREMVEPHVAKPIHYAEMGRREAEKGGRAFSTDASLYLVQTGDNLGFAGGCNVGLRFALSRRDAEYVWILNNDTVVSAAALDELLESMSDPQVGICGSTLVYYNQPDRVQALGGGTYNPWVGFAKSAGEFSRMPDAILDGRKPHIDYVHGASMLVSRAFLESVGLMTEEFFLYFEELDWACRAKGRFRLGYAPQSIVYHKEGATIGTGGDASGRSKLSDYYMVRNRFRINRKYFPLALLTLYLWAPVMLMNRAVRGQWDKLGGVIRAALWR